MTLEQIREHCLFWSVTDMELKLLQNYLGILRENTLPCKTLIDKGMCVMRQFCMSQATPSDTVD